MTALSFVGGALVVVGVLAYAWRKAQGRPLF